jgi:c-di-GMP-binding flagellar brake protein YcgR
MGAGKALPFQAGNVYSIRLCMERIMETSTFENNRRKYPRLKAPILYRAASFFSSRKPLMNISLGGIRVYSDEEIRIGKRLELELFLPDGALMVCTARVVWQKTLPKGAAAKYDIGLEFLELPPEALRRLEKVLEFQAPVE